MALILTIAINSLAQVTKVTLSGTVQDKQANQNLPYVNVVLKTAEDNAFVSGTVTNEMGIFSIAGIAPGNYIVEFSYLGYARQQAPLLVGRLSEFLDLGTIKLKETTAILGKVVVEGRRDAVAETMEKKVFRIEDNIAQTGGSLLQVMQNLPGVTITQEGTVRLRGSDRVTVLIDGKQTALTGFGNQTSLDNIPASAIDKIEVINNPSAKYDANGNAGIINIVFRKEVKEGFNGKAGLSVGLGALWIKKENYPTIDPQYRNTPKINPSLSLNYRTKKTNIFFQADNLYTHTLNKNEFVDRIYDSGDTVRQQTRRNRNTNFVTAKSGIDWFLNDHNTVTLSGLFSSEKIIDHGEEPFFNNNLSERRRLWRFLEDELKTTVTVSGSWQHKYLQPGRHLSIGYNYTFHRENEKYFFTNVMPTFTGEDSFKLISDEHVTDLTADYLHPLRHGRMEAGAKLRVREIPTDMQFFPGLNSPLDVSAGGYANYSEIIPVVYGNYVFESKMFEAEAGLRVEYVDIYYKVDPNHNTYRSDGYNYTQPFPNLRLAYKIDPNNTLSLFYTRRVDRPNEVDIRIFPKYDDAEIIKVGNPGLRPQFTNSIEAGYKTSSAHGYVYGALYHKEIDATIIRLGSIQPGSTLIYNIFQNAGHSRTAGAEIIVARTFGALASMNLDLNGYHNMIDAFSVVNQYPEENVFSAGKEEIYSGSIKLNCLFHLPRQTGLQLSTVYLAPDIVPQGKTYSRFSIDVGAKKTIQDGRAEIFVNATDIANTMRVKKHVTGNGFRYLSNDYYETQVVRVGYTYKF